MARRVVILTFGLFCGIEDRERDGAKGCNSNGRSFLADSELAGAKIV